MAMVVPLILAAGEASRFGGVKQLAKVGGKPLIQHVIDALSTMYPGMVHTVLGAYGDRIAAAISDTVVIRNPDWPDGLGGGVARGVSAVAQRWNPAGILITLADQAALTAGDYAELGRAFTGDNLVAASYAGTLGAPAIFPRRLYPKLAALSGEEGARKLMTPENAPLAAVETPRAALDIDTPADLDAWMKSRGGDGAG